MPCPRTLCVCVRVHTMLPLSPSLTHTHTPHTHTVEYVDLEGITRIKVPNHEKESYTFGHLTSFAYKIEGDEGAWLLCVAVVSLTRLSRCFSLSLSLSLYVCVCVSLSLSHKLFLLFLSLRVLTLTHTQTLVAMQTTKSWCRRRVWRRCWATRRFVFTLSTHVTHTFTAGVCVCVCVCVCVSVCVCVCVTCSHFHGRNVIHPIHGRAMPILCDDGMCVCVCERVAFEVERVCV